MYKKSYYNVEIENDSEYTLMYNTHSGVFSELDKESLEVLDNIPNFENFDEKQMEIVSQMKSAGFIVDSNLDEIGKVVLNRKFSRSSRDNLDLIIAPTMDCNMICPYCFETHAKEIMSEETQQDLVLFAEKYIKSNNCKHLGVTWFGGEPLLEPEIIYSLSDKLIKICEENNVKYHANIVTNGALLTKEVAQKLKEKKVAYAQITIDGPKEIHDRRRMLKAERESFDLLINNIESAKDFIHISIRINVDKENKNHILDLAKYFLEGKGWLKSPSFYLAPVDNASEKITTEEKYMIDMDFFAHLEVEIAKMKYKLDQNKTSTDLYPNSKNTYCGAERIGHYVVAPDGLMYSCWNKINVKQYNVGNVKTGPLFNYEYTNWLDLDLSEDCMKCVFLPRCQGGCTFFRTKDKNNYACIPTLYSYKDKLKFAHHNFITK